MGAKLRREEGPSSPPAGSTADGALQMGLGGRPGSSLLMFLLPAKWEAGSCRGEGKAEEGLGLGERLSQGEDAGLTENSPGSQPLVERSQRECRLY